MAMRHHRHTWIVYAVLATLLVAGACGPGSASTPPAGVETASPAPSLIPSPADPAGTPSPIAAPPPLATIGKLCEYPCEVWGPPAPVYVPPVIPDYPGATLVERTETKESFDMRAKYLTADSIAAAEAFYRAELPKYGWTDRSVSTDEVLNFRYDPAEQYATPGRTPGPGYVRPYAHSLSVYAREVGDRTQIELSRYVVSPRFLATPTPLVPPPAIPEYPGATLVLEENDPMPTPSEGYFQLSRTYLTGDDLEKVRDFFKEELPKNGWNCAPVPAVPETERTNCTYPKGPMDWVYWMDVTTGRKEGKTEIGIVSALRRPPI